MIEPAALRAPHSAIAKRDEQAEALLASRGLDDVRATDRRSASRCPAAGSSASDWTLCEDGVRACDAGRRSARSRRAAGPSPGNRRKRRPPRPATTLSFDDSFQVRKAISFQPGARDLRTASRRRCPFSSRRAQSQLWLRDRRCLPSVAAPPAPNPQRGSRSPLAKRSKTGGRWRFPDRRPSAFLRATRAPVNGTKGESHGRTNHPKAPE